MKSSSDLRKMTPAEIRVHLVTPVRWWYATDLIALGSAWLATARQMGLEGAGHWFWRTPGRNGVAFVALPIRFPDVQFRTPEEASVSRPAGTESFPSGLEEEEEEEEEVTA